MPVCTFFFVFFLPFFGVGAVVPAAPAGAGVVAGFCSSAMCGYVLVGNRLRRRRRSGHGAADDPALRALAGAGVGVRALAAHGQAFAMAQAAVAAQVHQALDVQAHLAAEVTLDLVALLETLADPVDLVVGQVLGPPGRIDLGQGADLPRAGVADPVQVRERDLDLLLTGKVDSGNSRHSLPLPLLVAWIRGADHAHHALAADHLALHANLPHRSTDLHGFLQNPCKYWNNRAFRALPRRTPTPAPIAAGASPAWRDRC